MRIKKGQETKAKYGGTPTYGYYKTKLSYYITQRKIQYEIINQLLREHKTKIEGYSKKIKILSRQLRKVQEREWVVRDILELTQEFMNTKLRYWNTSKKAQLGRNLIYKYALERKISGNIIGEVLKCGKTIPTKQRTRFTRSFATHPENKALWDKFNQYMLHNGNSS